MNKHKRRFLRQRTEKSPEDFYAPLTITPSSHTRHQREAVAQWNGLGWNVSRTLISVYPILINGRQWVRHALNNIKLSLEKLNILDKAVSMRNLLLEFSFSKELSKKLRFAAVDRMSHWVFAYRSITTLGFNVERTHDNIRRVLSTGAACFELFDDRSNNSPYLYDKTFIGPKCYFLTLTGKMYSGNSSN